MIVKKKYSSFATGELYTNTFMDYALIAKMEMKPTTVQLESLQRLSADCVLNIVIIRWLLTLNVRFGLTGQDLVQ